MPLVTILYMEIWPFYSPGPQGGYLGGSRSMLPCVTLCSLITSKVQKQHLKGQYLEGNYFFQLHTAIFKISIKIRRKIDWWKEVLLVRKWRFKFGTCRKSPESFHQPDQLLLSTHQQAFPNSNMTELAELVDGRF